MSSDEEEYDYSDELGDNDYEDYDYDEWNYEETKEAPGLEDNISPTPTLTLPND